MMDWTDRHCRYFHRLLSRRTRLYTEMVTTGALLHGDVPRHLDFGETEHPVALQLGGSEPADLAQSARLGEAWGYDEINLNCGCPSERVQRGAFGACLMAEPKLVADCVKAMVEVVDVPVTVKHRIGIDKGESYDFVYRLKQDFPQLTFALNGGVTSADQVHEALAHVDGAMIGREAYHNPWWLASWDHEFFGDPPQGITRESVEIAMADYMAREKRDHGTPWPNIARHMLGLRNGLPGARRWRRVWIDHKLRESDPRDVIALAEEEVAREA